MAAKTLDNGIVRVRIFDEERIEVHILEELKPGTEIRLTHDEQGEPKLETFYQHRPHIARRTDDGEPEPGGTPPAGAPEPGEPPAGTERRGIFGFRVR